MGMYLNPFKMTKEDWLSKYGKPILPPQKDSFQEAQTKGDEIVCHIDNWAFTAAAVCYLESELLEFLRDHSPRPKQWFLVPRYELIASGGLTDTDIAILKKKG